MNDQGPILVALDGSELAEGVLPVAAALARAERAELLLVTVWGQASSALTEQTNLELERAAREYFETYLRDVRERLGQRDAGIMVRGGEAASEIIAAAEETSARMIVAGSHGRSGVGRWLYGSTTSALLHEAPLPLLVVGPAALRRQGPFSIRRILVPLDGSPVAEIALTAATRVAQRAGANLDLVRVVPWAVEAYPFATEAMYVPVLDRELEDAARMYIERHTTLASATAPASGHVLRGHTADQLLTFSTEHETDLVLMTTRARSGMARAALGSTADRMTHGVAPVFLLRAASPVQ
jgi:nucleotide-binding universal stress UspA family protein